MTEEHLTEDIKNETMDEKSKLNDQQGKPAASDDQVTDGSKENEDLKTQLQLAEETAAGYLAQLTRLQADFVNFRRRVEREREEQIKYANEKLLLELLPVVDNLERALTAGGGADSPGPLLEGVGQVLKQFLTVLAKEGATPLDPGLGQPFNPEHQEALLREEGEAEVVVEELLRGWRYRDRVLRPTLVKVGPEGQTETRVETEAYGDINTTVETDGTKEVTREDG